MITNSSKNLLKAILFDLDDTLWPIVPVILKAENALYEWIKINAPNVAKNYDLNSLRELRDSVAKKKPDLKLNLIELRKMSLIQAFKSSNSDISKVDNAMNVFLKTRNQVELYDDVRSCLPKLKKKYKLGSITNGGADLDEIEISKYFDISISAYKFGLAKPNPEIFLEASKSLKLNPNLIAYVGDNLKLDVEGSQKAGFFGIWLNRFQKPVPIDCKHITPHATFNSLHSLENWLKQ